MKPVATAAVVLLALITGAYGAYLLLIGQELAIRFPSSSVSELVQRPVIAGIFPLGGALLVIAGVWRRSNTLAWLGCVVIAAYSIVFLSSSGGILIPLALVLAGALAIRTRLAR